MPSFGQTGKDFGLKVHSKKQDRYACSLDLVRLGSVVFLLRLAGPVAGRPCYRMISRQTEQGGIGPKKSPATFSEVFVWVLSESQHHRVTLRALFHQSYLRIALHFPHDLLKRFLWTNVGRSLVSWQD